ncbi:MAG: FAD-dependent oxidoreductase [Nitratireductor sp.]|nr:FAD-dependent oxidoreductase [Nitratireductor sp.]
MTTVLTPDICVIGAGSGGLTVAAAAAAFGVSVVLIEKGKMGGDCLNYGCVPSKAIIAAAKHAHAVREAPDFGVMADAGFAVDARKVNDHVKSVIAAIEPNDSQERFTALGVTVIRAAGRFTDANTVIAGDNQIRARRFVVATGSSAFVPPIPGLADADYFTNETIFENRNRLRHLIVIGGGPIGMEMAQAHLRLGSQVTVIEGAKALGKDDPELTAIVLDRLRSEGLEILEQTSVSAVEKRGKTGLRVVAKGPDGEVTIDGSHILVATGRAPNVEGLGLDTAGIRFSRKGIEVDAGLRTTNRKVYAIGDVAGSLQFTHVAGYHAGLVIRSILFRQRIRPDTSIIPWVTFVDPEIAHVGMSEAEAAGKYRDLRILRWPYAENDRAQAERKTTGLIKVVADRKGRILGATIAGANAGEMIHVWALALTKKMKLSDMTGYVAPYPTMTEIGKRAAVTFYAPLARKPIIRSVIGLLRKFG